VTRSGDGTATTTWRALWDTTADVLADRAAARWLCEVASGLDGADLLDALDEAPTQRMVAHLDAMVARYRAGEPLQYVLGRWSFRHLDLAVDPRVLIPRPETEVVAEWALALAREARATSGEVRVADLGTGSGAIGLALADELPLAGTTVWLTDVSGDALDVARANLAGIGRAGANVRIAKGDWFDALPDGERFDVVVANPPYVEEGSGDVQRSVVEWEPHGALFAGADGLDDIRRLVRGAPARLAPHGWLVLEIGASQGPATCELLAAAGYRDVAVHPDLAGRDRVVVARRPVEPPR
jgi:release factor glutamine methyltransferase